MVVQGTILAQDLSNVVYDVPEHISGDSGPPPALGLRPA